MTASPTPFFAESAVVSHETAAHETQPVLRSTDETQAPAAMSSEEEIARAIYHGKPRNRPWDILPHEFKNQYLKQARAVLALFTPILAEKERGTERACANHANATIGWERERGRSEELEARALAAEAALAAERGQGLVLVPFEPTKAMLEALDDDGDRIWDGSTEHYFRSEDEAFWYARQVWAAMVRAAAARSQEQP